MKDMKSVLPGGEELEVRSGQLLRKAKVGRLCRSCGTLPRVVLHSVHATFMSSCHRPS